LDALYTSTAIELGHTFYLGTKYTSSFNATYMPQDDDSKRNLIHMGCYGLGISRMIAAIAQLCHDEVGLKWPESVAPWRCIVLQPKAGGGEEMYDAIASAIGSDDVIFDDRRYATIGAKMHDAKRIGFPWIAVLGKKWETNGLVELVNRWTGEIQYVEKSVLEDPNFWNQPAPKDLAREDVAQQVVA
jgi:prolyl-tRNA synthetase